MLRVPDAERHEDDQAHATACDIVRCLKLRLLKRGAGKIRSDNIW
jgi:hypothetical protein